MDRKEIISYLREVRDLEVQKFKLNVFFSCEQSQYLAEKEKLENNIRKRKEYFIDEYNKASNLLNKLYSMNVLPESNRNMASVWYIYDRMSNGSMSLQDVMECDKTKNEIERIESRINEIMSKLDDGIIDEK